MNREGRIRNVVEAVEALARAAVAIQAYDEHDAAAYSGLARKRVRERDQARERLAEALREALTPEK